MMKSIGDTHSKLEYALVTMADVIYGDSALNQKLTCIVPSCIYKAQGLASQPKVPRWGLG